MNASEFEVLFLKEKKNMNFISLFYYQKEEKKSLSSTVI